MAVLTLEKWNLSIGEGQPLVCIAGLNVLEDLDLALETARHLKAVTAALDMPFIFKASFDKANRSSAQSYRGPGMAAGLEMLARVKAELGLPICTDIHEVAQAEPVAEVADVVQIPAFLCRQTDLVSAAAKAVERAGGWLHVKKGQFLAPEDGRNIIDKINEAVHRDLTILCERGVSFGYNMLVSDMRSLAIMARIGCPVVFDATHSVMQPGGQGERSGGQREFVPVLARAAVAVGVAAVFMETHEDPDNAPSDGPNMVPIDTLESLIRELLDFDALAKRRIAA